MYCDGVHVFLYRVCVFVCVHDNKKMSLLSQNAWDIDHLTAPNSKLAAFTTISNPVSSGSYFLPQLTLNMWAYQATASSSLQLLLPSGI